MTQEAAIPLALARGYAEGSAYKRVRFSLIAAACMVCQIPLAAQAAIGSSQFTEALVGGNPAIDSPGETWGTAWGDYNGDGYPDLWLGKHQYTPTALYRNNGDGTFTNVIGTAVLNAAAHYTDDTHGAAWADFDNDGDQDLIEVCGAGTGEGATAPEISDEWRNNLFVNSGGLLIEDAQGYGIDYPRARSRTPLWVDFDRDGTLDIVIAALQTLPEHYPSAVFRQTPAGFVDATAEVGFAAGSCQNAMQAHLGPGGEHAVVCGDTSQIGAIYDISSTPFADLRSTVGNAIYNGFPFDLAIGDFDGDLVPDVFAGVAPPNPSSAVRTGPANDRIHSFLAPAVSERGFSFTAPGNVQLEFGYETVRADIRLGANGVAPPTDSDPGLLGPNLYPHRVRLTLSASNPSQVGMPASRTAGIYIGYVANRWEVESSMPAKT